MEKVIKLDESTLLKIIKKIIVENDFGVSFHDTKKENNKEIKLIIVLLKDLTRRTKGNKISKEDYIKILNRLAFYKYSKSEILFNFFNEHVQENFKWDDPNLNYLELINSINPVKEGLDAFVNKRLEREDILEFTGSGGIGGSIDGYIEEGWNEVEDIDVDIKYIFMGSKYWLSLQVNGEFEYSVYRQNGEEYAEFDEEEITMPYGSNQVLIYDEDEHKEHIIDMDKATKDRLLYLLTLNYSPPNEIDFYNYI